MYKQIKQLIDDAKFQEALQLSTKALDRNPKDKPALYFCAASYVGMNNIGQAQASLNQLYSLIQKPEQGKKSDDDQLYFQALLLQKKLAICLQTSNKSNSKAYAEGINQQIECQYQILDFLDKKGSYEKMLEEVGNYVLLCMESNQLHFIEDTYLWLFQHHALSADVQLKYGCLIFSIEDYKPKVNLEQHFQKLASLHRECLGLKLPLAKDDIESLKALAKKLLQFIDRQSWKKDIHAAIQAVNLNPNAVSEYKRYTDSLIAAGDIFYYYDNLCEFAQSDFAMMMFARYLCAKSITIALHSPEWDQFIKLLEEHANNEYHANTCGDLDSNPVQLLIHAFIDFNKVLQTGVLPTPEDHQFFQMIINGYKDRAISDLEKFSEVYGKMSPIVNAYYAIQLGLLPLEVTAQVDRQAVFRKLELADFLNRKILFYKLVNKKQPSDLALVLQCLKIQAIQTFSETEKAEQTTKIEQSFEKQSPFAQPKFVALYQSQMIRIRWKTLCDQGKWQEAISELDQIAKFDKTNQSWATLNRLWIQFSYANEIAPSVADREILLQNIQDELIALAQDKNDEVAAQALMYQGYLNFMRGGPESSEEIWLAALKKDTTRAEIFYSLAVWYYFTANDTEKAKKCADKALSLKPDFEQAFLLMYELVGSNEDLALQLLNKLQRVSKNSASAYFLKGVILHDQADYIQAIDNLQNATKFYTADRQKDKSSGLKPTYPLLNEIVKMTQKPLSLFESQLGIFGVHPQLCVQAWVLLTDCFSRIDKPQVALKCFQKSMEEISVVIQSSQNNEKQSILSKSDSANVATSILATLRQVKSFIQYPYDKQNEGVQQTLDLIEKHLSNAPKLMLECVECLLIGARLIQSHQFSLRIASLALEIISGDEKNNWQILEVALHLILVRLALVLQEESCMVFGKPQISVQFQKKLDAVKKVAGIVEECLKYSSSLNLQKAIQVALITISQKTPDENERKLLLSQVYQKSVILRQNFAPEGKKDIDPASREILVDAAKIAHECSLRNVNIQGVDLDIEKIRLTRRAIQLEPQRAELWALLHKILPDESSIKAQAIFKAYELEPDSQDVQSQLIKYYMQSSKGLQKAFRVIVKSYQQSINQITPQNPVVIATLAFLNAKSCFLDKKLDVQHRKAHLLESLSLINQVNDEKLIAMLTELRFFLLQEKGDYLHSIKFLDHVCSDQKPSGYLKLLLLQAYMGTQYISYESVQELYKNFKKESLSQQEEQISSQLQYIFKIENVQLEALKMETESTIREFSSNADNATRLASKLTLLQEISLQLGVLPETNLLDQKQDVLGLLDQLDPTQERLILAQSLRFLHKRDGTILEQTAIKEEGNQQAAQGLLNYSRYLTQFARLSNPIQPQLTQAQNKSLFRLYLEMNPEMEESHSIKMHSSQLIQSKDHKLKGLQTVIQKLKTDLLFAQKQLMKNPVCLKQNINWVWSLFHKGQSGQAVKAFNQLQQKLQDGVIKKDSALEQEFNILETFVLLATGQVKKPADQSKLDLIATACNQIDATRKTQEISDDVVNQMSDSVAVGMLKSLLNADVTAWPQILNDLFSLLKIFVFDQRQITIFNKIVARMLKLSVSLLSPQAFTSQSIKQCPVQDKQLLVLINDLWVFKCLHTASGLSEIKKLAGCDVECNAAFKVMEQGLFKRNPIPANLMKARAYTLAKNFQKANDLLEASRDQELLERDFIVALTQYAQQAYKQFYLGTIGLVAGCKRSVEKLQTQSFEERRQVHFNLAYSYYLKAFAEATFHAARKQNLVLQEDFTGEIDADIYKEAYFFKKVTASLNKCATQLAQAGEQEGLLMSAVKQMQTEIALKN